MEWCDCYIVALILVLVGIIIYKMADNFTSGRCGVDTSDDNYLKRMPFMDDIIYQNPAAFNRRGYDILNSYNRLKVGPGRPCSPWLPVGPCAPPGPEVNFHQKFNRGTMGQMGWRTWYLSNFC